MNLKILSVFSGLFCLVAVMTDVFAAEQRVPGRKPAYVQMSQAEQMLQSGVAPQLRTDAQAPVRLVGVCRTSHGAVSSSGGSAYGKCVESRTSQFASAQGQASAAIQIGR